MVAIGKYGKLFEMGRLINLNIFRSKKPKLKLGTPTEEEAFAQASEGLFSQWMFHAEANTLNSFIAEKFREPEIDWLSDRNAVAELEEGSNFEFSLLSPGYTLDNILGWQASFMINGNIYETPVLEFETHTRVYCVLLYHALLVALSDIKAQTEK